MSFLSGWVISIVGVVIIGVLIDVVIADGQTSKYIKSIFAIITVFVIAMPVPKLINGEINLDTVFGEIEEGPDIDEKYLAFLYELQLENVINETEKIILSHEGVVGTAGVESQNDNGRIIILKIKIGINGGLPHINIVNEIVQEVMQKFNIKKEMVEIYGRE